MSDSPNVQAAHDVIYKDTTILPDTSATPQPIGPQNALELDNWIKSQPDKKIAHARAGPVALESYMCTVVHDSTRIAQVKALKGNDAQVVLDYLQHWMDRCSTSDPNRRRVLYLLVKLSAASNLTPKMMLLPNITRTDDFPWRAKYCDVYRGTWNSPNGKVPIVVKTPRPSDEEEKEQNAKDFMKEAFVWRQLRHPNVYPFEGFFLDTKARFWAVSRYTRFEDLEKFIMNPKGYEVEHRERYQPFVERERLVDPQLWEIAEGLTYIHSQAIVHVDLKLPNVFIDNNRRACISDFGSGVIGSTTTNNITHDKYTMSNGWIPPDYVKSKPAPRPEWTFDVYAYGCICATVCSGTRRVYEDMGDDNFLKAISVRPATLKDPKKMKWLGSPPSDTLWSLVIEPCRDPEAANRPEMQTIRQILAKDASYLPHRHPFLFPVETVCDHKATCSEELSFKKNDILQINFTTLNAAIPPSNCPSGCTSSGRLPTCDWKKWHEPGGGWWIATAENGDIGMLPINCLYDPVLFNVRAKTSYRQGVHQVSDPVAYIKDEILDILAIGPDYQVWLAMNQKAEAGDVSIGGVWAGNFEILDHVNNDEPFARSDRRPNFEKPKRWDQFAELLRRSGCYLRTRYRFEAAPRMTHGASFQRGQHIRAVQYPNLAGEWIAGRLENSDDIQIFPVTMLEGEFYKHK